jgi:hypothetical protein
MPPAKPARTPAQDIVVTTTFGLIGVALLSLLAGVSDRVGRVIVILMVGFALVWAMANTAFMEKFLGKPSPQIQKIIGK